MGFEGGQICISRVHPKCVQVSIPTAELGALCRCFCAKEVVGSKFGVDVSLGSEAMTPVADRSLSAFVAELRTAARAEPDLGPLSSMRLQSDALQTAWYQVVGATHTRMTSDTHV